ncbi:MAG: cellulase family glycosylhydrolase [Chitinispirillaceae bacterium]|nr:cellulase family glycosylhydrolase [Chitinispirillaceae bacterium]
MVLLALASALFVTCCAARVKCVQPACGIRVSADKKTLVAADGKLLRGAFWSADYNPSVPDQELFDTMKILGMNTLHLYAESFAYGSPAGYNIRIIDEIVKLCRMNDMYLVVTIGNIDRNGEYDMQFIRDFWTLYAPRYANLNTVVYEIQNEPVAWNPGYPPDALQMQVEA